jgi:hypothetical protein
LIAGGPWLVSWPWCSCSEDLKAPLGLFLAGKDDAYAFPVVGDVIAALPVHGELKPHLV